MNDVPIVNLTTHDPQSFEGFFKKLYVSPPSSHKGQNGSLMIIGGSALFHSAVVWPAETASHFADMVHVSSTEENNEIIKVIKTHWRNGIVVPQKEIPSYIAEDDAVLLGNGLMRTEKGINTPAQDMPLETILQMKDEGEKTFYLTRYLLSRYPEKRWVLDAGALQMMKPDWLTNLKEPAIVTPHLKEYAKLFGVDISSLNEAEKADAVTRMAHQYRTVILLKAGYDVISDGERTAVIHGGNAGLTKGGTGDILAALTASFYAKNNPFDSAVCASLVLKCAAEELAQTKGIWYNSSDIISVLPQIMDGLMKRHNETYKSSV